jgi:hypothetical protein
MRGVRILQAANQTRAPEFSALIAIFGSGVR